MRRVKEAGSVIAGLFRGYLDRALLVDQQGVEAVLPVIGAQQFLQVAHAHADADDAHGRAVAVFDLTIYEDGDLVSGRLVVVHVQVIIGLIFKEVVVPCVFPIVRRQHPVQAVEVVVAVRACRNQKDRIIAILFLVGVEVILQLGEIFSIAEMVALPGEEQLQQAVVGHRQRHVQRPGKEGVDLVIDTLRRES